MLLNLLLIAALSDSPVDYSLMQQYHSAYDGTGGPSWQMIDVEFDGQGFEVPMDYSGDMQMIQVPTYHSDKHFRLARKLPDPIVRHLHTAFWRLDNLK